MNLIKSFILGLSFIGMPMLMASTIPATADHRLAIVFDEKVAPITTIAALENLDGAAITLIELLASKATPILVNKSTVQDFLFRRNAIENPYSCKDSKLQKALLRINHVLNDIANALKKQHKDQDASFNAVQNLLNTLAADKDLRHVWHSLAPAYLVPFKESDWIIREVNAETLLLVPQDYVKARATTINDSLYTFTARELALGLKIDHLPPFALIELKNAPAFKHTALSWRMRDEILSAQSPLFITHDEYEALNGGRFESKWQIYAYGHGYYTDKEELFDRVRCSLSGINHTAIGHTTLELIKHIDALHATLDHYTRSGERALTQEAIQKLALIAPLFEQFNTAIKPMDHKVFDHTFFGYAWDRIQQQVKFVAAHPAKENAAKAMHGITVLKEAMDTLQYLLAAPFGNDCKEPALTNNFWADLRSGRFLGMRMSHVRHLLQFLNNQVQTDTLFVVTCYGAGDKIKSLFNDPVTKQPITLNYRYITGAFTDAAAFGDEYHSFDTGVILTRHNDTFEIGLQPQHNFEQFFSGLASRDEKKLVSAIDAAHPLFPVRRWVNNLPLVRQAHATTWQTLMTDGTVVPADQVNAHQKNAEVVLLHQPKVQELIFKQQQLPFIISDCSERQHTIVSLEATKAAFSQVLESFYGVPTYKADFAITINKLVVKNDKALAKLNCSDDVVTLEKIVLQHKQFDSALKTNLDTISFMHNNKRYRARIAIGIELCESNVAQLLDTLAVV